MSDSPARVQVPPHLGMLASDPHYKIQRIILKLRSVIHMSTQSCPYECTWMIHAAALTCSRLQGLLLLGSFLPELLCYLQGRCSSVPR